MWFFDDEKTNPKKRRKYSWKPDLPDQRDHVYRLVHDIPTNLPPRVDLSNLLPLAQDQGHIGSCTAHALTGAVEALEAIDKLPQVMMSRLFVYYNERDIEGTIKQDAGAQLRDGIKVLADTGCCSEDLWLYDEGKFADKPPQKAFDDAAKHRILSYQRLETLTDAKACLAAGFPFVFGFTVYESFESDQVARCGICTVPQKDEECLGGHAVLCIGYNDQTQMFMVRNSWGSEWGKFGNFFMPYRYLEDRNLSDDLWTIRRGTMM